MNNIGLKAVKELIGLNFFIPDYQRGYRWTEQQVKDLLDDIYEFMNNHESHIYCIQPLVVKHMCSTDDNLLNRIKQADSINDIKSLIKLNDKWEVIDGQQRLTTIYIILKYLSEDTTDIQPYMIEYETRKDSWDFLCNHINNEKVYDRNIDYYHMGMAYQTVMSWFESKDNDVKTRFHNILKERVKFIWHEISNDQNSKDMFQRLNLGKISLTNSELIKAMLLKRNYDDVDSDISKLQISTEWDIIEGTLQNDELWAFISTLDYNLPTRIDYIFEILRKKDIFAIIPNRGKDIGDDEYATFRYFYYAFTDNKLKVSDIWQEVYKIYEIFIEWYNTSSLYHYIGYIIATSQSSDVNESISDSIKTISDLIADWKNKGNKRKFEDHLIDKIKLIVKPVNDLSITYNDKRPISKCRPLLLLHNIETIIIQNRNQDSTKKFGSVFYRFPYNLYEHYKDNVGWDVEHIDSNTASEMKNQKDRKDYLECAYWGTTDKDLKQEIIKLRNQENIDDDGFNKIREQFNTNEETLSDEEKNKIWNFALLDSKTNRGYGNSPFPAKRRIIIGKERGIKYTIGKNDTEEKQDSSHTFIPPCTRNAFLKYYSNEATNFTAWLKRDAVKYRDDMLKVLGKKFNIINSEE